MADNLAIARPYAKAAFELAHAAGQLPAWGNFLEVAAVVVKDPEITRRIGVPGVDTAGLVGVIADVALRSSAGVPAEQATNLLKLLGENRRLAALPDISRAYNSLKAEIENRVEVTLTAAVAVDEGQQAKIVAALKRRFGREVNLKVELDPTLLGGARLRADDLVIDGSVRAGLDKLASVLAN